MWKRHVIMNYFGPRWRKGFFFRYESKVFPSLELRARRTSGPVLNEDRWTRSVYIGRKMRRKGKETKKMREEFNLSPSVIGERDTFASLPVCSLLNFVDGTRSPDTFAHAVVTQRTTLRCCEEFPSLRLRSIFLVLFFFIIASLFDTCNLILFFFVRRRRSACGAHLYIIFWMCAHSCSYKKWVFYNEIKWN